MSEPFGKFFAKTFTGSMRGKGSHVISLMAYAVSHAKPPEGIVEINVELVAFQIGDSVERIQQALDFLMSPDPQSRTKDEEGKRLVKIGEFAYKLVTWQKHRDGTDVDARRAYWAERQAASRASKQDSKPDPTPKPTIEHDDFSGRIYAAYPLKVGKPAALRAIRKAMTRTTPERLLEITAAFAARKNGDMSFVPHPSTWFNQERYNDDPSTWDRETANGRPKSPMDINNIIKAKETLAGDLKRRHCSDTATDSIWDDPKKKAEFFNLRREIKTLTLELSAMA